MNDRHTKGEVGLGEETGSLLDFEKIILISSIKLIALLIKVAENKGKESSGI